MFDLVVRGGTVVDGTGAPARRADVAISGDRIVAVGTGPDVGQGRREVDAAGRLVTPGWVDMHTHYDAQATWDPELTPSGWHGVTTVVMGNCGVGFAPAAPERRDWLIQVMEGVEDIPGAALADGISWEWETFPEYLDALDQRRWVADVGTQVPHSALRTYVMGERGAGHETASADELALMAQLTEDALLAGALGFSTSRTPLHKAADGELIPGTFAELDELFAIADGMARAGHGVFQGAFHHPEVPGHVAWFREVARRTGRPVTLNLNQPDEHPDVWREVLALLDDAAADGLEVWAQVAGRPVGILMCWDGTVHPFVARPAWRGLAGLPPAERAAQLARDDVRADLVSSVATGLSRFQEFLFGSWDKMYPFTGETDYEPAPDRSVAAIAARSGRRPDEVAFDQLQRDGGTGLLYFPLFNYSSGSLDELREMHLHPRTRMGLADAGAHCATICDGSMPTFMVSFWTRDRERGERLPLELVVRRQTRDTAVHYGLADRGVLAPGFRADLNVIDLDRLGVTPPRMVGDLPTGAKRFVQQAVGYDLTVCAGTVVAEGGEFTGERPGRLVRGPQAAPG